MNIILAWLVAGLGVIIFLFPISNIILLLSLTIPWTKKLNNSGAFTKEGYIAAKTQYRLSLALQIFLFAAVTTAFFIFFRYSVFISLLVGYLLGLFTIIIKRKSFNANANNISDYLEVNAKYFSKDLDVVAAHLVPKNK